MDKYEKPNEVNQGDAMQDNNPEEHKDSADLSGQLNQATFNESKSQDGERNTNKNEPSLQLEDCPVLNARREVNGAEGVCSRNVQCDDEVLSQDEGLEKALIDQNCSHADSNLEPSDKNSLPECSGQSHQACTEEVSDQTEVQESETEDIHEMRDLKAIDLEEFSNDNLSENETDEEINCEQTVQTNSECLKGEEKYMEALKCIELYEDEHKKICIFEKDLHPDTEEKTIPFNMVMRILLPLCLRFKVKCVVECKTLIEDSGDAFTNAKSLISVESISPTERNIDLWAVRINVTPLPAEAREEAYRLGTFNRSVFSGLGSTLQLAREGFFCNSNEDIICAFCGRYLPQHILHFGQRYLNHFLRRHRNICNSHGNVSIGHYGINLATQIMPERHHALCISGSSYQQQGVCTFAQQIRRLVPNLVPSGTCFNDIQPMTNRVQRIPVHRDNASNTSATLPVQTTDRQGVQAADPGQDPSRDMQITQVRDILRGFLDSSMGSEILRNGYTRKDVEDAILRLLHNQGYSSAFSIAFVAKLLSLTLKYLH